VRGRGRDSGGHLGRAVQTSGPTPAAVPRVPFDSFTIFATGKFSLATQLDLRPAAELRRRVTLAVAQFTAACFSLR
jgi:hypothetical protein